MSQTGKEAKTPKTGGIDLLLGKIFPSESTSETWLHHKDRYLFSWFQGGAAAKEDEAFESGDDCDDDDDDFGDDDGYYMDDDDDALKDQATKQPER